MLSSPCHPNDPICNLLYTAYAAETQAIEDIINELARCSDPNDFQVQQAIYDAHGVNIDYLTDREIHYIENEIVKRRRWQC